MMKFPCAFVVAGFLLLQVQQVAGAALPGEQAIDSVEEQKGKEALPQNPPTSPASSSRAEQWEQQRWQKIQRITPYRQTGLERGLVWVEKKGLARLLNINIAGFRPKFGGLPTGSGFGLGTRFRNDKLKDSIVDFQAAGTWSFKGYQKYELQFGHLQPEDTGVYLYADLGSRNYPQEDFFGIGPQSRRQDRTDFKFEDVSYDGVVGYRFKQWFQTDFRAGYIQVNTDPGTDRRFPDTHSLFNDVSAPGLASQPDFFRMSYSVMTDYRDRPGNPHKGGMLALALNRFEDRKGGSFDFSRFDFDARHYLPLGSDQRVLAVRFFTSHSRPDENSRVPFYFQETLGGSEGLRGFREYRFRDTRLLYLSGEYRWEAVPAVEFVLFYDAGKVFSRRSDFDFEGLQKSFGIGIRFKTRDGVVFRVDAGRSKEGTRLYLKFGPSF